MVPGYVGASLNLAYNYNNRQISTFAEIAEVIQTSSFTKQKSIGLSLNFKGKDKGKRFRAYGGFGLGYVSAELPNPNYRNVVSSHPYYSFYQTIPQHLPYDGVSTRSQVGFNMKFARRFLFSTELGLHMVFTSWKTYPVIPLTLGLSYVFAKPKVEATD